MTATAARPGPAAPGVSPSGGDAAAFIADLRRAVDGAVDDSVRRRAEYSTDASNYRVVPQVVVAPRDVDDALAALAVAREHGVPVTPRGAGTSCAGNAVGPGLVLDLAEHVNRILDVDPEARTARVEPGVILSSLQQVAAPHGLRFGPDPSTQNRATLGGMIGNNACGPHAVAWGKTAENVLELDVVDGAGRRFTASSDARLGGGALDAVPGLQRLVDTNLADIRTHFGRFGRQVSGYSLEHLLPERGADLAKMLVGSEGTLGTVLGATVRLVPLPTKPVLVVLGYPTMAHAADAVPALLAHGPLAVEGLDSRLVDVVRRVKGDAAVPALPPGEGWLMVEVGALADETLDDVLTRARVLAAAGQTPHSLVVPAGREADALWRIRADGAGLGGRTPAGAPAWPGWEDAAVPPEKLGAYLRDFETLLAGHGMDGLLYGHFGDGCVHVRIDAPLHEDGGVARWQRFLEEAADLVAGYGGSLSGEHGDGRTRSELLGRMYPERILDLFGQVKTLLDPHRLLNPGVLVDPAPLAADLRRPLARPTVPAAGGFRFPHDGGDLTTAVHRCTGVGKCRADNSAAGGFMCPSFQATGDEKDVTRGRARVLQEAANGTLVAGWADPAVRESLDLCLSCKACATDCPTGMDMARYRAEVLHRTYRGRLRPRTHYTLGMLPFWTRLLHRVPFAPVLANAVMGIAPVRKVAFTLLGIDPRRLMPTIATHTFADWAGKVGGVRRAAAPAPAPGVGTDGSAPSAPPSLPRTTTAEPAVPGGAADAPAPSSPEAGHPAAAEDRDERIVVGPATVTTTRVLLWADSFSQDLDPAGARATVDVLRAAGYEVVLPPKDVCCGLTWISTGRLDGARARLGDLLEVLAPFAANGVPIIGVEPSCTAVLRDDLLDLLPGDPRARMVADGTYTLAELLTAPAPVGPGERWSPPDLTGVDVVAQPHCHHYSVMGWRSDEALLRGTGARVTTLAGCCGLAGNFGMEQGHYDVSVAVAENALLPALRDAPPGAVYLADGFSCRTQAQQLAGSGGVHLAQLLRDGRDAGPGR